MYLFLLETAVKCSYWYIFRVSLKSAPRYVNAMRPGSILSLIVQHITIIQVFFNTFTLLSFLIQ